MTARSRPRVNRTNDCSTVSVFPRPHVPHGWLRRHLRYFRAISVFTVKAASDLARRGCYISPPTTACVLETFHRRSPICTCLSVFTVEHTVHVCLFAARSCRRLQIIKWKAYRKWSQYITMTDNGKSSADI